MATSAVQLLLVVFFAVILSLLLYAMLLLKEKWRVRFHSGDGNASRTCKLGNPERDRSPFRHGGDIHLPIIKDAYARKRFVTFQRKRNLSLLLSMRQFGMHAFVIAVLNNLLMVFLQSVSLSLCSLCLRLFKFHSRIGFPLFCVLSFRHLISGEWYGCLLVLKFYW